MKSVPSTRGGPGLIWSLLLAFLVVSLVVPQRAHAYIDPMSGSIILQALAAGFLAALFVMKRFWYRITGVVRQLWARLVR